MHAKFLSHYYGNGFNTSISLPCPTLRTKDGVNIITPKFIIDYQYKSNAHPLIIPCPTLLTKDKFAIISTNFITNYYSNGGIITSLNRPSPTILGIPKQRLISCSIIDQQYGQSLPVSTNQPIGVLTSNPKFNIISWILDTNYKNIGKSIFEPLGSILACRKHHYLMNPQYNDYGRSIDRPCFTLIARMDKAPPYIIQAEEGLKHRKINKDDSATMKKIKIFMKLYDIVDIKMRMLKIIELKRIQGFPEHYILKGTQADQKRFIGNAVHPLAAKALVSTNAKTLLQQIIQYKEVI